MTDQLVRVATAGGVATITLDSPTNRNALSTRLMEQFLDILAGVVADDAAHVVVIDHTGPVFSSGADLKETAAALAQGQLPAAKMGELLTAVWECPKPVIAKIGGAARAGGLGVIAAADIAVCTTAATFAFSEVRLGVIPAIISATVRRRLDPRAAAELFLTGDVFDGVRAAEIGLVTRAVPAAELDTTVDGYLASLVRGGPAALAGTKKLLREPMGATVRDDLPELTRVSLEFFLSEQGREGVAAIREKRPAAWVPTS